MAVGSSPLTRGKPHMPRPSSRALRLIPAHAGKTNGLAPSPGRGRAHPRSRGENLDIIDETPVAEGSSPLTRGKLSIEHREGMGQGLIPAHAGKTVLGAITGTISGAHPRSRGENPPPWLFDSFHDGSSPLTRGKRDCFRACDFCRGLIPAHAGKTRDDTQCRSFAWAHPRSRGENP